MVPPGGMPSRPNRRAIVIGGSLAGLFVGAFLRRIGWQVDIYERSSIELIGRGVGIFATHLELFEALDKCGAGTVDIGVIVYKRLMDVETVFGSLPLELCQSLANCPMIARFAFGECSISVDFTTTSSGQRQRANPGHVAIASSASAMSLARCGQRNAVASILRRAI